MFCSVGVWVGCVALICRFAVCFDLCCLRGCWWLVFGSMRAWIDCISI